MEPRATQARDPAGMPSELTSGSGLVARWGINEGAGVLIDDSVGAATGTAVNGPAWIAGAPFGPPPPPNDPPARARDRGPPTAPPVWPSLRRSPSTVSDPDGAAVDVTFFGRPGGRRPRPRTSRSWPSPTRSTTWTRRPGTRPSAPRRTGSWTRSAPLNTVFVTHLGDITQNNDAVGAGMDLRRRQHMAMLDANGVPEQPRAGNHDMGSAGVAAFFDEYFPPSRYEGNTGTAATWATRATASRVDRTA